MKNKIIWTVVVIVVIVIVALLVARNGSKTQQAGAVTIGYVGPLSGDAAAYGQQMQEVIDYRLAEINAAGGTQFKIDYEDGKCAGSDAVSAFQKITNIDGVKIILGGACSAETLGIAPLTKDGSALAVSALSSNPTIEGASPYLFSLSYSDSVVGETIAEQMSKFSKVAIITEQSDYSVGVKNVWKNKIAQYPNVKIVADETFPSGATDFRSILEKVRRSNPDAILLDPKPGVTATNLLKQLAEMTDWKGYKLYGTYVYVSDAIRVPAGNTVAEGMTLVDVPGITDPAFVAYQSKIEAAKGTLKDLGSYYTASTIDTLNILTSLIREVGNNPQAVRDALATRHFTGYLGDIYFGGHSFKQGSQAALYVVTNGKAVPQ